MEDNKLLPKLSQNLLEILNDEEYYDITIEVEIFQIILRYIYGGKLSLNDYDNSDIIKATLNSHYYGPSFGEKDLIIWDWDLSDINYCIKSSYEKSIRKIENDFDVKECEVFQIDSH
ncbi:BTB/POZ protein [Rhizophagus irregularis DAOM 181602=DAOM 197198]|nr:BTB/POZ protein [Rhizophagus irregularis DAOM 181602=DAOM 197198]